MSRTFIREIGLEKITQEVIDDYIKRGFELVWKEDSVEVWAN